MTRKHTRKYIYIALMYSLLPLASQAQRIVSVNVETEACIGDSVRIGIGYLPENEVVVEDIKTSITHPNRVFLPDGHSCQPYGCSYRSPVTYSEFPANAQITSANDIRYLRINMEHSFIGDIYINITCPNGQKADVMRFGGYNTSDCHSTIPNSSRQWSDHIGISNMATSTYFGIPVDQENTHFPCDSNAIGNQPGTGWNYCWSSSTSGITYAHANNYDDGIIYRAGHSSPASNAGTSQCTVDSSDVAQRTNFYHPDESFSNLIGCPLNGTWYVEVVDGYNCDNGYVFDWELVFDNTLAFEVGDVADRTVIGNDVIQVNDSLFYVTSPAGTHHDTVVSYIVRIINAAGNAIDTTVYVHYYPQRLSLIHDTLCTGDSITWRGVTYYDNFSQTDTVTSPNGCMRITDVQFIFKPTYEWHDTFLLCPTHPIFTQDGQHFMAPGHFVLPSTTIYGCDSMQHLQLGLIDSGYRAEPLLSDDGEHWRRQRAPEEDSVLVGCVPFQVWFRADTALCDSVFWNFGNDTLWTYDSEGTHTYDSAGTYTVSFMAVSRSGCRDTVVRTMAVWVFEPPVASFSWDPQFPVYSHPQAQFYNQSLPSDLEDFLWLFNTDGGRDSSTEVNPSYSWDSNGDHVFGDFDVTLKATYYHPGPYNRLYPCSDDTTASVTIINDWLQFPNLVTPNGDGVNDRWEVVNLLECGLYTMNELWVYDAWGVLVYHVRDINDAAQFWDPDATRSPDGTYYFRFSGKSLFGLVRTSGAIEVVRKQ